MIDYTKENLLFHGSYTAVPVINLNYCQAGLDFGKGFYLTSSMQQAVQYVPASVNKAIRLKRIPSDFNVDDGQISVYQWRLDTSALFFSFQYADEEWLHYISSNRSSKYFSSLKKSMSKYDILKGKVADDDTATVLFNYINGIYGEPGTVFADELAIRFLEPHNLHDQYCFKSQTAIASLEYLGSERYGNIKHLYGRR